MREVCNPIYLVSIRYVDFQRSQAGTSIVHGVIYWNIEHLYRIDQRYKHEHKCLVYIYPDLSIHRLIGNQFGRV